MLQIIADYRAEDEVVISSFHKAYLREARQKAPKLEVAVLFDKLSPDTLDEAVQEKWQSLHPWYRLVDGELMEEARRRGLLVRAWTVNRAPEMTRLLQLGVNGIITNFPDLLRSTATGVSAEQTAADQSEGGF